MEKKKKKRKKRRCAINWTAVKEYEIEEYSTADERYEAVVKDKHSGKLIEVIRLDTMTAVHLNLAEKGYMGGGTIFSVA